MDQCLLNIAINRNKAGIHVCLHTFGTLCSFSYSDPTMRRCPKMRGQLLVGAPIPFRLRLHSGSTSVGVGDTD